MSKELLGQAIMAVYERLARGELRPDDVVSPAQVKLGSPRHWIDGFMLRKGVEDDDARILRVFRKEHGAILDVGAYWGYMAASFRNAGATSPIVSFEPMPAHHACLDELRRIDGNYDFARFALGDKEETVKLYGPVVNGKALLGLNSVDGRIFDHYHKEHLVSLHGGEIADAPAYKVQLLVTPFATRLLDTVLTTRRLRWFAPFRVDTRRIAVIKVDVEGHEPHVLRGAAETLARHRPFIMIESGNRNRAVAEQLSAAGYRYAERDGLKLVEKTGHSDAPNGFWFHGERAADYAALGLL
jgi:FkbM family methyltransferase